MIGLATAIPIVLWLSSGMEASSARVSLLVTGLVIVAMLGFLVVVNAPRVRESRRGAALRFGVDGLAVGNPGGYWVFHEWQDIRVFELVGEPRLPPRRQVGCLRLENSRGNEVVLGPWWTSSPKRLASRLQQVVERVRQEREVAVHYQPPAWLELLCQEGPVERLRALAQQGGDGFRGGPVGPRELELLLLAPNVSLELRLAAALALGREPGLADQLASPLARHLVRGALAGAVTSDTAEEHLSTARRCDSFDRPGLRFTDEEVARLVGASLPGKY